MGLWDVESSCLEKSAERQHPNTSGKQNIRGFPIFFNKNISCKSPLTDDIGSSRSPKMAGEIHFSSFGVPPIPLFRNVRHAAGFSVAEYMASEGSTAPIALVIPLPTMRGCNYGVHTKLSRLLRAVFNAPRISLNFTLDRPSCYCLATISGLLLFEALLGALSGCELELLLGDSLISKCSFW